MIDKNRTECPVFYWRKNRGQVCHSDKKCKLAFFVRMADLAPV